MKIMEGWKITQNGGKLLVDISVSPWDHKSKRYFQREKIVYDDKKEIILRGYKECEGLKTDLAYWRMPVYVKFTGWKKCDYRKGFTDKLGIPCDKDVEGAYP